MKFQFKSLAIAFGAVLVAGGIAFAVAPPANTVIGNQATASYTDSTGAPRTTNSNVVQTVVAQVNAFNLTQSQTKSVAPGGTVYFPHTVTNTGNGTDNYALSVVDGTANGVTSTLCTGGTPAAPTPAACNVFVYPDADGNGVPDSNVFLTGTSLLTTPVAAGGTYKFVLAMQWPATVITGTETLTITAISQGGVNGSAPAVPVAGNNINTDTINVSSNAVISVTKALSKSTGARSTSACAVAPFGTVAAPATGCENILVTLSYTNTGGASTSLTITDAIGTLATSGFNYIAGSAAWSGCAAPLTDAAGGDCANMAYDFTGTTATAVISNIAPGQSGTLTFAVNITPAAPTGAAAAGTTNVANFSYTGGPSGTAPTNPASYVVVSTAGVVATSVTTGSGNLVADDTVTIASAPQGGTVWFKNIIWNTGTDTDSFDMTVQSSTFPAGTAVSFYSDTTVFPAAPAGASGSTAPTGLGSPLTDTNGNGTVDTGPIAANAYKVVWTKVDLQPNTTSNTALSLTKKATSKLDSTKSDTVVDTLTDITEKTVDLRNSSAVGPATQVGSGAGFQGGAASPAVVTTNTGVLPGSKTRFNLVITPSTADTFDLTAWNDYGAVATFVSTFGTGTQSGGYGLSFFGGACPAVGVAISSASITNTGVIPAATSYDLCAEITVPASAAPGTVDVYFRAISPSSGSLTAPYASWDVKHDAFTVASTSVITITPDRVGTTFPGGNVVYAHQVCNTGNAATTVGLGFGNSNTAAGFTTALWLDVNGNGVIDAGDTPIPQNGIVTAPAGGCVSILDNTFAPSGGANGISNTTTITASTGGTDTGGVKTGGTPVGSITDTTQIVVSDIGLLKEQREVTCLGGGAGTPVGSVTVGALTWNNGVWTSGNMSGKINPGACIQYRITATNSGSASVTGLTINDTMPPYTTLNTASCSATANTGTVTTPTVSPLPANGAAGSVGTSSATITALGTVQLVFCVKIDN